MFRTSLYIVGGSLLLASASTFAGRGSIQQFELTVVPSLWTFAVVCCAAAWAFGLRGTRDLWMRAGLALAAMALLVAFPKQVPWILFGGFTIDWAARRLQLAGATAIAAVGLITTCQLPAFWLGLMLNGSDISEAKAYCESFVPKLEAHYDQTGDYPRTLSDLQVEPGMIPRLLDGEAFYTRTGNRFQFSFQDPSGLEGGLCYDSFVGSWRQFS